jgi:CO2 hydration protein
LEAGGSMLPDTPENLMQIIGIYKAYAVPMDFYWRDLLYIAERVFLNPLPASSTFCPRNIWTCTTTMPGRRPTCASGAGKPPPTQNCWSSWKRGGEKKWPKLFHHLWHDRVNMEFAEACMRAMLWHQDMGGRFNDYLYTDEYKANCDRAIKAYFKRNPLMLGLHKLFPEMFYEKCRELSYYSNLGLFWEVMAPVFFEMSDIYDEGGFRGACRHGLLW